MEDYGLQVEYWVIYIKTMNKYIYIYYILYIYILLI